MRKMFHTSPISGDMTTVWFCASGLVFIFLEKMLVLMVDTQRLFPVIFPFQIDFVLH